jgi:hypothetical protein
VYFHHGGISFSFVLSSTCEPFAFFCGGWASIDEAEDVSETRWRREGGRAAAAANEFFRSIDRSIDRWRRERKRDSRRGRRRRVTFRRVERARERLVAPVLDVDFLQNIDKIRARSVEKNPRARAARDAPLSRARRR